MANMKPPQVPEVAGPGLDPTTSSRRSCGPAPAGTSSHGGTTPSSGSSWTPASAVANSPTCGSRTSDFDQDVVYVIGKGRRPRACPFGAKTAQALDRYLRERNRPPGP